jgi:ABC-2 type transport system ATP-binding protein
MTPALELQSVSKSFGDYTAVDGVSFCVPRGTIYGLLGPNGAGKTTTLRMIMDIIAADSGLVLLDGHPRYRVDLARIGYLPEERGLYRKMTVTDHLAFLAELHGIPRREAMPAIGSWLERVELAAWGGRKVEELSKGMQQKIQLVGTVLHDPELIILDEPFSGLDPINQGLFKDLLAEYQNQGKTIIFSTHIMEQAEKLCDNICLISQGRTILEGELSTIKRQLSGNSYRLVADGDLERLDAVHGVRQALYHDGSAKLLLEPGARGSDVLSELVSFLQVHEFRSQEPDLEEIFIKAVRDAAE